jgi:hypothetical protein
LLTWVSTSLPVWRRLREIVAPAAHLASLTALVRRLLDGCALMLLEQPRGSSGGAIWIRARTAREAHRA